MYSPKFSELAAISVRRLAWAMDTDMGKAVDLMVKALPAFINTDKVCELCKDKSKCKSCTFKNAGDMPEKALELLFSPIQKRQRNKKEFVISISTIKGLASYIKRNSYFSIKTINSVIVALGYNHLQSTQEEFIELSGTLKDCSKYGAEAGFSGFINSGDTINFFKKNRHDIVSHIEQTAKDCGMDIISFVQNFGIFRRSEKPTPLQISKALWESKQNWSDLNVLYNVFAWYALEEVSNTWYRYFEENTDFAEKLSA